MRLSELNNLLKAYGIIFECDSCETTNLKGVNLQPRLSKEKPKSKKIRKVSAKTQLKHSTKGKKVYSARKSLTERKPSRNLVKFFDDSILSENRTLGASANTIAPKSVDFFYEFKLSCDNFITCPQFDNTNNAIELKNPEFDYETAVSSLDLSQSNQSVSLQDLDTLKKDLFNQKGTDEKFGKNFDNNLSLSYEDCDDFELDFDQHSKFSEFFSFA